MIQVQMRIRAAVLAVAFCAVAMAGHSSVQAKDNWTSVRSQNFQLIGNASEKDIRLVANRLEQFRTVFTLLFPAMKLNSPVPTQGTLFNRNSSFKPFHTHPTIPP